MVGIEVYIDPELPLDSCGHDRKEGRHSIGDLFPCVGLKGGPVFYTCYPARLGLFAVGEPDIQIRDSGFIRGCLQVVRRMPKEGEGNSEKSNLYSGFEKEIEEVYGELRIFLRIPTGNSDLGKESTSFRGYIMEE